MARLPIIGFSFLLVMLIIRFIPVSGHPTPSPLPVFVTPAPSPTPLPTSTPVPLTFAQLNELFGPCTILPVLYYHHIEPAAISAANHRQGLGVDNQIFAAQMAYLSASGYQVIPLNRLIDFFTSSTPLPAKSVALTFDDAYVDFKDYAWPILRQYNFPATVFLPTGLADNPGYLNWSQIEELSSSGLVTFANHTWSHRNLSTNPDQIQKEISTADTQLTDHHQNPSKIFAYPFGTVSSAAKAVLSQLHYQLAFTTVYGRVACSRQALTLPRLRIGNAALSAYGL